ncbi:MAG TPA: hypothetical protein VIM19_03685 [Actinomycetes bacterium]
MASPFETVSPYVSVTSPPKHRHVGVWIVAAFAALILVVTLVALAVAAGLRGTTPNTDGTGFNDPATLAQSIKDKTNASTGGAAGALVDVTCVPLDAPRQFLCRTIDTNGTTYFVTATVSPDGTSWITGS